MWAVLVLVQHWIAQGRPLFSGRPLGSYESWSGVVGGVLETAGINGFLANSARLLLQDQESAAWEQFVAAWWGNHRDRPVTVDTLAPLAEDLLQEVLGDGTDRSQRIRLGKALGKHKDTVFAISDSVHVRLNVVEVEDDKSRKRTGYDLQALEKNNTTDIGTLGSSEASAENSVLGATRARPNVVPDVAAATKVGHTTLGREKTPRQSAVVASLPNVPSSEPCSAEQPAGDPIMENGRDDDEVLVL